MLALKILFRPVTIFVTSPDASVSTTVEIDLDALRHNYRQLKSLRGDDGECFAVVKQNAYGHGLSSCARALSGAGADGFAVSDVQEGACLRRLGIVAPVMVMSDIVGSDTVSVCSRLNLELVLGDAQALSAAAACRLPRLWIKINTGMNRYGIHPADVGAVVDTLKANSSSPLGLMTHLADADSSGADSSASQLELFRSICAPFDFPVSVVNSAGYLRWHSEIGDRARCGIALYGSKPVPSAVDLQPVMTVRSRVLAVQRKLVGDRVGYNLRDRIGADASTAVLAAGYADGYPFPGALGAPVLINGEKFPLVGRTSMNMIVADISTAQRAIAPGDEVVLWGRGLPIDIIARKNSLIPYQLMCAAAGARELQPGH